VTSETPIVTNMEAQNVIEFMLNNVLVTVIFFVCLLSFILIFSLMQTDVEERTYEFAVLRTVGMRNQSLVTLITIQSLLFSIPGILLGFIFLFILVSATEHTLNTVAQVDVQVFIQPRSVVLGIVTGLFIPFLSNIIPIK
jgi:ABC-type antimicrobial peptide transport system permease subunit